MGSLAIPDPTPESREKGRAARRTTPWLREARLVPGRSLCRGRKVEAGVEAMAPPGIGDRRGGWGPNPVRRLASESSASWTRRVGSLDRGSVGSWLCSWAVSIAEVDGRHALGVCLWQSRRDSRSVHVGLGHTGLTRSRGAKTMSEAGPRQAQVRWQALGDLVVRSWCLRKQGPRVGRGGEGTRRGKASWFRGCGCL